MATTTRPGRRLHGTAGLRTTDAMGEYYKNQQVQQQRYQTGLGSLQEAQTQAQGLYQKAMGAYQNYGRTAIAEAKDIGQQQQAQMQQQMIGSGIAGSTILPSMQKGIMGRTGRTISAILEERANKQAGLQTAQAGATLQSGATIAQYMQQAPTGYDPGMYSGLETADRAEQERLMKYRKLAGMYSGSGLKYMPEYLKPYA